MNLIHRLYSDYLLPSRLGEYERILISAIEAGYEHRTLTAHYRQVVSVSAFSGEKVFIHRHDIDTDPRTARMFFELERKHGVRSSYYFRLSTLDVELMKEIHEFGSEVGYHYEEIATYCKQHGIKDADQVSQRMPEIRKSFVENLAAMEARCGFKFTSVASHGDFVNRRLGIANHALVDKSILDSSGIMFECYDPVLLKSYSGIISDAPYPKFYHPNDPFGVISRNTPTIYMLSHPRHWRSSLVYNFKDDLRRLIEGLKYRLS